ncbi:hypothetical protein AQF98_16720 [Pedobacter sp. Hv1]|nr:hypothetical protein AQF98_16720 [Pedobacter sp. Hv1]
MLSILVLFTSGCKKKDTPQDPVEQYVTLLKSNTYEKYTPIPKFTKDQIGALLKHANDTQVIQNFPIPMASSFSPYPEKKVGIIILYTIEGIRLQSLSGPSTRLHVTDSATPQRTVDLAEVFSYYSNWWDKNKDKSAEDLKKISPFEGTTLFW